MVNNKKIIAVKGSGMIACLCSLMLAKYGHDVIHVSKGVTKKNDMFFAITPTSIEWFRELGFPDIFFDQLHNISEIQLFDEIYGNEINFKADDFYIDSLAYTAKQKHFVEALKDLNTNINTIVDDASISYSCNAAVCSAPRPPAFSRTAATTPSNIAHVILDKRGESLVISTCFFEESMEATNAPESEEVTKKVTININEIVERALVNKRLSNNTNKAVLALLLTAPLISPTLFRT